MRWAVLVTMCACGRLGFDPGATDGAGDGSVIPDADRRPYRGSASPVARLLLGSTDGDEIWASIETADFADSAGNGIGEYNLLSRVVNGAFAPMELQSLALD